MILSEPWEHSSDSKGMYLDAIGLYPLKRSFNHGKESGILGLLGVVTSLFGPVSPSTLQRRKARGTRTSNSVSAHLSHFYHSIPTYHTFAVSNKAMVL
jgi:hypothetical protein